MGSLLLNTLVVVYLLIPGFMFSYGLVVRGTEEQDSPRNTLFIPRSLGYAMLFSLAIHLLWGWAWHFFSVCLEFGDEINYAAILSMALPVGTLDKTVSGELRGDLLSTEPLKYLTFFAVYLGSQVVTAYMCGTMLAVWLYNNHFYDRRELNSPGSIWRACLDPDIYNRAGVDFNDIPHSVRSTIWGDLVDEGEPIKDENGSLRVPYCVYVTVAFPVADKLVVYRGLVGQFEIGEGGSLEIVSLWGAKRRYIDAEDINKDPKWKMLHHHLVLNLKGLEPAAINISYEWEGPDLASHS